MMDQYIITAAMAAPANPVGCGSERGGWEGVGGGGDWSGDCSGDSKGNVSQGGKKCVRGGNSSKRGGLGSIWELGLQKG